MIEVLASVIIASTLINAAIGYLVLKELRYGNSLTILTAQRRPGHRRSATILRLPHIDYGDNESLIDEA